MDNSMISKIDGLIEQSRQEIADLTIKLVNIKSELEQSSPGAPFGKGVRRVLDTVAELGENEGFTVTDHGSGVISAALFDAPADLGIWLHADIVPAGDGWSFEPFNAVEYEGRIIGRGSADNKGQIAAIFTLLKIFKKLGIKLNYNPALFVGSNEEKGMFDLLGLEGNDDAKGFLNTCVPPKLSLVPDGAFPVGYGGKGNLFVSLITKKCLSGVRITAGQDETPGKACACFDDVNVSSIVTSSMPCHSAHPSPDGNMITELCEKLLESDYISQDDRPVFEFLKKISTDITGETFGINVKTEVMQPLTVSAFKIDDEDGNVKLHINIRYPIDITMEEILERISSVSSKYGFELCDHRSIHKPYLLDKNNKIVDSFCKICEEITGEAKPPYLLSGGTYAHELPNAYVFGSSSNFKPESWPKGRGGAHGIDEAVSLDRLQRAMRIYARALLTLNEIEW